MALHVGVGAGTPQITVGKLHSEVKLWSGTSVTKLNSGSCKVATPGRQLLRVFAVSTPSATSYKRSPRPENVPGEFFVDHTCIDCDTCRWMAPAVFARVGEQAAVHHQPASADERVASLQALLSCPTASIHTMKPPLEIIEVQATFPLPIDGTLPGVYHCGYHSNKSFGAASYFITRSDGNILVDSPRYTQQLAQQLEKLGGVKYMFLSHRDDVADHARWQKKFQCERIIHKEEVNMDTADVEIKLEGVGPWNLGPDIDLIHTPGHTKGCVSLLYKPVGALFSGDHVGATAGGELSNLRDYNWYSVKVQIDSIRLLLGMDFLWILPGHNRRIKFKNIEEKNKALQKLINMEESILTP